MLVKLENAISTSQVENLEMANRCLVAIDGITDLETAYQEIKKVVENVIAFYCGKGGSHIWVSNWNNERLLFIIERDLKSK